MKEVKYGEVRESIGGNEKVWKSGAVSNHVVSMLFNNTCGDGGEYETPTRQEVVDFLDYFAMFVGAEYKKSDENTPKKLTDMKSRAITNIKDWIGNAQTQSAFQGVQRIPFAFELAQRVRKPKLIEQKNSRLCGPVAVLVTYGKLEPVGFAKLGMELISNGSGSLRHLRLQPSSQILAGFPTQQAEMGPVDYVMLVSFRQCANVASLGELGNVLNETTTAGTICQKLTDAGYEDVRDHTFLDHGGMADPGPWQVAAADYSTGQKTYFGNRSPGSHNEQAIKDNLSRAQTELNQGRFVIISGHGDIAEFMRDGAHNFGSGGVIDRMMHRQFTAARKIEIRGNKLFLRLITWGGAYEREIPWALFHPRYDGYVSAKP